MRWGGVIVLLFIVYHLLHFTLGEVHSADFDSHNPDGTHDVYSMVVKSFQHPLVSVTYVAAMVVLCAHLGHGLSSVFQTLGFSNPKWRATLARVGPVVGGAMALGYISIPTAVMLGILELPEGVS